MKTRMKDTIFLQSTTMPSILTDARVAPGHGLVHRGEVLSVLERAARDPSFIADVGKRGSAALRDYGLSLPEQAALISGDVRWIEDHVGELTQRESTLLTCMLQREAW